MRYVIRSHPRSITSNLAALLIAGGSLTCAAAPATTSPTSPAAPAKAAAAKSAIRINAGASAADVDAKGTAWLPDQGFIGGDTIDRGSIPIANTETPSVYRTEHYDMSGFTYKLPNGKYTVRLHFAETFEEITGTGQRVFTINIAGHVFKDFDVWAKAGGGQRAYVETVSVEITDGKLDITFTSNIQSPEINGIEIIPAP